MSEPELTTEAPLFPLPGVFLFPGQVLPLHIFEPRYRQMIEDLLDGPGRLVIGTIAEGENPDGTEPPKVVPIAGYGEIARHERLPDGRFQILLFGLARVHVEEVASDRLYRRVRCTALEEDHPSETEERILQPQLLAAIKNRTGYAIEDGEEVSAAQLADILAQTLTVPQELMEEIYSEESVGTRIEKVLAAHEHFPAPDPDED